MRLKSIVPDLKESTQHCFVCKNGISDGTALSDCCSKMFHYTSIFDLTSCPYCWVHWGGGGVLPCKKPTVSKNDCELCTSNACHVVFGPLQ